MADDRISPRRPRSLNGAEEAAASIQLAEKMGLVPVAGEPDLDDLTGARARERDYRARPPAPTDRRVPFVVKP